MGTLCICDPCAEVGIVCTIGVKAELGGPNNK